MTTGTRDTTPLHRSLAWAMLAAQSLIVLTGALVRLTGSGLGCAEWPTCNDGALVPYGDLSMHSAIEFGNRLLGVALGLLGAVTILSLWTSRRRRPDLFWYAVGLTAVVPVQAVLGGVSVLTELNPWIVAAHFFPSAAAVVASALFVRRTRDSGLPGVPVGSRAQRVLAWAAFALVCIVVVMGVLVTGAGPHAGDEISARNGLDTLLMARLHAAPVWALCAVLIGLLVLNRRQARTEPAEARRMLTPLLTTVGVVAAQGVVGYVQFFTGVPWMLVAVHIVGICTVLAAATWLLDAQYRRPGLRPVPQGADAPEPMREPA
ncbi:COX15/CtaA family protein [Brevibacterium album]|uniref:COX15/CtaA family protein n=1 Tax=Brevibacterium album TaxID=417948 RepID=UPI000412C711|nr:COX15/CtaA family protein [Brevibacterium album]